MTTTSFRLRRHRSLAVTTAALVLIASIVWIEETRLANTSFFTGLTLFGALLMLVLLGVRRRLPVLALGSVSHWTQIHIYAGLFASGVYVLHVPALIGNGLFESTLSILFLAVALSGFYGIVASRTIPKRLTTIDGEIRFDQYHWHRGQIRNTANELIDGIREQTSASVIQGLYNAELGPYFSARPSLIYLMLPSSRQRRRLLIGLTEVDRYIEREGRNIAGRLAALIRRRDDLDYQYALQLRLRLWVIFHGLMSIALLAAASIHGLIAWRFAG